MSRIPQRGLGTTTIIVVVIVIFASALAFVTLRGAQAGGEENTAPDIFEVQRGSFDIAVPASGELAALKQEEIASQLDVRAVITWIVDEGILVKEGDLLIELDDEDIRDRVKDVGVVVKNAETQWKTAMSNLEIRENSSRSQLMLAGVDIELAELAIRAWHEGSDVTTTKQLVLEVETAKKDFVRLEVRYLASQDLFDKEFISKDELDRDEIEKIRASSRFEQATIAEKVYWDITREQELKKLEAALKKAEDAKEEIAQRNASEIENLRVAVENRKVALDREREREAEALGQLDMCRIIAPQDGLVVYTSSLQTGRHGRNESTPPQIGTELPRNRAIIALPDTSRMVAEVKVNEALSGKIQVGQSAVIVSDALPDATLSGEVISVGVLAETGGWRDPNRRDYTVRIALLDGNDLGLKPSMRCKADIYVGRVEDALFVPVQAIFRKGPIAYVYVPDGAGYAPRPVMVGRSSELYIQVLGGVEEGDHVLLREPPEDRITARIDVGEQSGSGGRRGGSGNRGAFGDGRPEGTPGRGGGGRPGAGGGMPGGARPGASGGTPGAEKGERGAGGGPKRDRKPGGGRPAGESKRTTTG